MHLTKSLLLVVVAAFVFLVIDAKKDRVKLRDVGVLTFYQNDFTRSRRSSSIPQLRCIGGTASCVFTPKVVQCSNTGFDGVDVQWQCKADLKNKYSFGRIVVNCEGYDYPDDDNILAGSCGLEYELDFNQDQQKWSNSFTGSTQKSESGIFGFGFILFALCAIALIYFFLPKSEHGSRQEPSAPPPPPGFHSNLFGDSYSNNSQSSCGNEQFAHRTSSSTTSNLWSGAIGAGLGYMLGRNSSSNYPYTARHNYYNQSDKYGNDTSEEVRTATGFAKTKRR